MQRRQFITVLSMALVAGGAAFSAHAAAPVRGQIPHEVIVSLSAQSMQVFLHGRLDAVWPVSTARRGKVTPKGSWSPDFLSRNHRSSRYNGAPMPYSIFYHGNYAIHGTNEVAKLGNRASAGCIRLHPDNARILFERVRADGLRSLRITVTD